MQCKKFKINLCCYFFATNKIVTIKKTLEITTSSH